MPHVQGTPRQCSSRGIIRPRDDSAQGVLPINVSRRAGPGCTIERDRIVRQWTTLRNVIRAWLFNPVNGIAVGQLRYNGRGEVAVDSCSVRGSTDEMCVTPPRAICQS